MTVLVYLRSSFGFAFLRPKSVFFAFSWAFILTAIYAWIDGTTWHQHRAAILFGCGAILLYWTHLSTTVIREWKETSEHDNHSGSSHYVWLMWQAGRTPTSQSEAAIQLWAEPASVILSAAILRLMFAEQLLSRWLFWSAFCLWSKEALNRWFHIRQRKRRDDIFDDTGDVMELPSTKNLASEPPKPTRKARIKRARGHAAH